VRPTQLGSSSVRLYAHHPTRVAGAEHRQLPLHVQDPPVEFLSWPGADKLIETAATLEELKLWLEVSSWYRCIKAATTLVNQRDTSLDVAPSKSSAFDKDDIATLEKAQFIKHTTVMPAILVRLFAAVEERNEVERRRVISWPPSNNEAEKS
jgi:hypothetical protein